MPKARAKLDASVITDFENWVKMGAPDPRDSPATDAEVAADTDWSAVMKRRKTWWSFQPLKHTDLSTLPSVVGTTNPVDRFLAVKLSEAHLPRESKADKRTLIRRLSYTLRGIPPKPEEIEHFINDKNGNAYQHLVETFLASPQYGECWARHWMDWVRYADSHGSEGDPMIPYAWRYRDYLIRSLNADVPYHQLVREHIAGDLLTHPRINSELGLNESALGIGHLRMVFHGFAPTDALEEQIRFTDDQIGVVSKAFLGLTITCARCHNHKFDPVSQKDYYAWYGVFASCPPATVVVDAPDTQGPIRLAEMVSKKKEIKEALIKVWLSDSASWTQKLKNPDETLKKEMMKSKDDHSLLHPFFVLENSLTNTNSGVLDIKAWWQQIKEQSNRGHSLAVTNWNLASERDYKEWHHDGPGVASVSKAGEFTLSIAGKDVVTGIYPAGVYSHLISSKDRGVILSPRLQLTDKYDLWMRIAGDGDAVARYVVQNYPRDGTVFPYTQLHSGNWHWVKQGLDYWQGDQIHVEVTTAADQPVLSNINAERSWFGVSQVVVTRAGDPGPDEDWPFAAPLLEAASDPGPANADDLAQTYSSALRVAVEAWREDRLTDSQALLLDQFIKLGLLKNHPGDHPDIEPLVASYRQKEAEIRVPRRAQGVMETEPFDQALLIRGDHKQPSAKVVRSFLEAIDSTPFPKNESGRRELAESIIRSDNPLTSRVIVNRVWHHLFGKGIVVTPDNFGRMGKEPSHPELLDYLALWFQNHGYSIKQLIEFLVLSDSWQMSSEATPEARGKDPANVLLSHFNVRRLDAEAVRDGLLSVSGDLKQAEMYGPPVLGREPRRSVYVRVKRNELDPFLAAFDAPVPSSTTGKREVTNVPGQSLTLLNDPFVIELAEHWAGRVQGQPGSAETATRIQSMFVNALGRPASSAELKRSKKFLEWSAKQHSVVRLEKASLDKTIQQSSARIAEMKSGAKRRLLAEQRKPVSAPVRASSSAIASWNFANSLDDIGGLSGKVFGNARMEEGGLVLDGKSSYLASAPLNTNITTKTLEAWVQLGNLEQQGGGVMSLQELGGNVFDAIVYGERKQGRWLAGSDGYSRTQDQDGEAETNAAVEPVHVAITYSVDGVITLYRNGVVYGKSYSSKGPISFEAGKCQVLFGNRHGEPGGNKSLTGKIFQARLYDRALSPEEIKALANFKPDTITENDIVQAMTPKERTELNGLKKDLTRMEERMKLLNEHPGLSSEWADLSLALFNLKEFIFIR